MVELIPKAMTALRSSALLAFVIGAAPVAAQSGTPSGYASVRGAVIDSVRGGSLVRAFVELRPGTRKSVTNDLGEFKFDSVPAGGGYSIRIAHPMLDTIGIALATPEFSLQAGDDRQLTLAVPSPSRLVSMFCPPALRARGPSALIGFVRDPDTGAPIDSATVSLVYDDGVRGIIKQPVNRVAKLDSTGRYKICGLPPQMTGKVQLIRNGTQSADIPVSTDANSPLALRSIGLSLSTQHIAAGKDSSGNMVRLLRGSAKLTGRVLTKSGTPIAGARVQMDETAAAATTGSDGRFTLDSLPTGTQTVTVRKLGFTVTDRAVEVSLSTPAAVLVVMEAYVPTLDPIVSIAQRDKDKEKIGFTRRKNQGMGTFREGEQLTRGLTLESTLAAIPGTRVGHDVTCMTYIVDGVEWKNVGGRTTISDYVRPDELEAIEVYSPSTVPMEFAMSGRTSCQVVVLWTSWKIHGGGRMVIKPLD